MYGHRFDIWNGIKNFVQKNYRCSDQKSHVKKNKEINQIRRLKNEY